MKKNNLKLQETKSSLWKLKKEEEKTDHENKFGEKLEKMYKKWETILNLLQKKRQENLSYKDKNIIISTKLKRKDYKTRRELYKKDTRCIAG